LASQSHLIGIETLQPGDTLAVADVSQSHLIGIETLLCLRGAADRQHSQSHLIGIETLLFQAFEDAKYQLSIAPYWN